MLAAELELRLPDLCAYTVTVGYFTSTFVLSWIVLRTICSGFVSLLSGPCAGCDVARAGLCPAAWRVARAQNSASHTVGAQWVFAGWMDKPLSEQTREGWKWRHKSIPAVADFPRPQLEPSAPAQQSLGKGLSWEIASCCCRKASFGVDDGGLTSLIVRVTCSMNLPACGHSPTKVLGLAVALTTAEGTACLGWYPGFRADLCEKPPFHSLHYVSTFFQLLRNRKNHVVGFERVIRDIIIFLWFGHGGLGSCLLSSNSSPLP